MALLKSTVVTGDLNVNNNVTFSGMEHKIIPATGTAAVTTSPYKPALWRLNLGVVTPAEGDMVTFVIPVAGHSNGVCLSLSNGSTDASYKPISVSGASRLTTHYPVGTAITLVYDADGSTNDMYAVAGAASRATMSGGCWRVVNYYDSGNSNTLLRVWSSATNLNVPLVGQSSANSTTATWTTYTDTYKDWYGAIPNDDAKRVKINLSTGVLSVPSGISGGKYNGLTLTAATTGFTIAGGTTSKTLTVSETYTLGAACAKGVTDSTSNSAISTGTSLTTERDVYYGLVTVNGASQSRATGIYAPTGAGTSGQYLKSSGSGAPTWANFPTIPTITLNGSSTTSPSFYAPTSAGTSGQYLKSAGSGAPTWETFSKSTVGLGNVTNDAQVKASLGTTKGDIVYWSAANTPARLGIGTAGYFLKATADGPSWSALPSANTSTAGIVLLGAANGAATYAHTHTTSVAKVTTGTSAVTLEYSAMYKITAGGTETIFTMPGGSAITLNGTSTTSANFYAPTASGTANQILQSAGANTAPTWRNVVSFSSVSAIGWANPASTDSNSDIINRSAIAYWNGAYSGTTSNLAYCNQGAFGSIVVKAAGDYVLKTGGTFTGSITVAQTTSPELIAHDNTTGLESRLIVGSGHINHGLYSNGYATSADASTFTSSGAWIIYRGSDGEAHSGLKIYGAVWNDYAEYRKQYYNIESGRVVYDLDDGHVMQTEKRLMPGAQVVSDTFGFAIGETKDCKTPLAVSGRVLVYTYRDRHEYHAGDAVCSAPNGTIDIMTREEIKEYPDAIIGIVSEIPEYNTWGSGEIPVKGRIWIKVR